MDPLLTSARFFAVAFFFAISVTACSTTAPLLYTKDTAAAGGTEIWKQAADGSGKTKLIANGERGRWIPGNKTHLVAQKEPNI